MRVSRLLIALALAVSACSTGAADKAGSSPQESATVHPESGLGHAGDHTTRAAWLGQPLPLDVDYLRRIDAGEISA